MSRELESVSLVCVLPLNGSLPQEFQVSEFAYLPARGWSQWPGIVLGLGLGGFVDGIVLHQIGQWHNMGSAVLPPTTIDAMSRNMLWDGWFHAATLILTTAGVFLLLRDARHAVPLPSPVGFTGLLLLGWGIFNVVEGLIDHHLLEIHHVRDMPRHVPRYDWLFLGLGGVGLMAVGWLLARARPAQSGAVGSSPS